MQVYPLVFDPIFKPKIWGGRRLAAHLGKRLPDGELIGESWELSDLPGHESVVREGPCRGQSLRRLVDAWGDGLLGAASPVDGRFPLLIKFLDASCDLSVQVHPPEFVAAREPGAAVKDEAWYVVMAEPGAAIYRGLNPGVTRAQLVETLRTGEVAPLLRRIPVRAGDCCYLPSGTVHALGAGVLVAEVQTPSDTTYRLFDWNRIDESTGAPRALHVEQALRCIDFETRSPDEMQRAHAADMWTTVTRLVACPRFVIEKVRMIEGAEQRLPAGGMAIWMLLSGEVEVIHGRDADSLRLRPGDVALLPAALQDARVRVCRPAVWLDISIPGSRRLP